VSLLTILSDPTRNFLRADLRDDSMQSTHFPCSLFPTLLSDPCTKRLIDCVAEQLHGAQLARRAAAPNNTSLLTDSKSRLGK
jgi:hypothetical protein